MPVVSSHGPILSAVLWPKCWALCSRAVERAATFCCGLSDMTFWRWLRVAPSLLLLSFSSSPPPLLPFSLSSSLLCCAVCCRPERGMRSRPHPHFAFQSRGLAISRADRPALRPQGGIAVGGLAVIGEVLCLFVIFMANFMCETAANFGGDGMSPDQRTRATYAWP